MSPVMRNRALFQVLSCCVLVLVMVASEVHASPPPPEDLPPVCSRHQDCEDLYDLPCHRCMECSFVMEQQYCGETADAGPRYCLPFCDECNSCTKSVCTHPTNPDDVKDKCFEDSDCPPPYTCPPVECSAFEPDPNSCTTNEDCEEGLICAFDDCGDSSCEIPTKNGSSIVSHNLPSSIECGEALDVVIEVKNAGETTWTEQEKYRLGAVGDENLLGGITRVYMPADAKVKPGETWAFSFQLTGPPPSDQADQLSFLTRWQMVHEHHEWFGPKVHEWLEVTCTEDPESTESTESEDTDTEAPETASPDDTASNETASGKEDGCNLSHTRSSGIPALMLALMGLGLALLGRRRSRMP